MPWLSSRTMLARRLRISRTYPRAQEIGPTDTLSARILLWVNGRPRVSPEFVPRNSPLTRERVAKKMLDALCARV